MYLYRTIFKRDGLAVFTPLPLLAFVLLLLLAATESRAQGSGEINGTVYDGTTPIQGAVVTAENSATGELRTATTEKNGYFRFPLLSTAGAWSLSATAATTTGDTVRGIILRSGEQRSVLLRLNQKGKTLTVTARRTPLVNTSNAEVSAFVSEEQIESIPTDGRKVSNQLYFLPGASPATGYFAEAPNVSINGQNSLYTNYLIDGFDNNEQFLGGMKFDVPIGVAQNVAVLTNSYSAEYGRTANGIINITTKSGTNDLKGEVFYTLRPGSAIDAHNAFAPRGADGEFVDEGFTRNQFGFSLGGPIAKDKTFFFLNTEITRDTRDYIVNTPIVSDISTGTSSYNLFTAKIDHHWNETHHTSLRANVGIVALDYPGGGTVMEDAGNYQDRDAALIALKHTMVLSPTALNETRLQYSSFDWNYARPRVDGNPQVSLYDTSGNVLGIVGNPGYSFDATEKTWQLGNTFIKYSDRHTFKGGFDLISADHSLLGGGAPYGAYSVILNDPSLLNNNGKIFGYGNLPTDPNAYTVLSYSVESRPQRFGTRQNLIGLFAEDSYAVTSNLTVNLGVRWDFDNLSQAGSDSYDLNNLAPRTSFNLKLDQEGTKAIRGGYGIFYEKLIYSIASDAMQFSTRRAPFIQQLEQLKALGILPADADVNRMTFDGNATATFTGSDAPTYGEGKDAGSIATTLNGIPATELRILNPNGLQNPYSHQISLGYQQQFGQDFALSVDGVLLFGQNLVRLRDLNAPTPYEESAAAQTESPRSIADADATRPAGVVQGERGRSPFRRRRGKAATRH